MAYVTEATLKTFVAAQLRMRSGSDTLIASYDVVMPYAVAYGYGEIRGRLLNQGYSTAQIDAWDRRVEFSLDLGTWYCLRDAASLQSEDNWVEKFNRAKELDGITVLVNDVAVAPQAGASLVKHGTMKVYNDLAATFIGGDAE